MQAAVLRTGSFGAAAVAILYLIIGVNHFLWPYAETPEQMMQVLVDTPIYHYVETFGYALVGFMLIPVITAFGEWLKPAHAGISRWATIIGYVSCFGAIISNLRMVGLLPLRAAVYLDGDAMVRAAIQYNWVGTTIDVDAWLRFGCFGVWMLMTAWLLRSGGEGIPRSYILLVVLGALVNLAAVAVNLGAPLPGAIVAVLGAIVIGPLWALWTAVLLSRQVKEGL